MPIKKWRWYVDDKDIKRHDTSLDWMLISDDEWMIVNVDMKRACQPKAMPLLIAAAADDNDDDLVNYADDTTSSKWLDTEE